MALHLNGENALRRSPSGAPKNYVIVRPGALVNDEDYPSDDARDGVRLMQGDNMGFMDAGVPGLAHTPLARALVTQLLGVEGRLTVEVTCGTTDPRDASAYANLARDGDPAALVPEAGVVAAHALAVSHFRMTAATLTVLALVMNGVLGKALTPSGLGWRAGLPATLAAWCGAVWWWASISGRSVESFAR